MKRAGRLLGLLLALLAPPLAGARAEGQGIPASHLWASLSISSVSVSPEGDWVVEAQKNFRRVQGWREIEKLVRALSVFEAEQEVAAERVA